VRLGLNKLRGGRTFMAVTSGERRFWESSLGLVSGERGVARTEVVQSWNRHKTNYSSRGVILLSK
jgi:hypothetical protein